MQNPPIPTIVPFLSISQHKQFQQLAVQMAAIVLTDTKKNEGEPKPSPPPSITIKLTHKVITT